MKKSRILQGDCLDVLKSLPANSVDSIVTDPPYGLSKEPDIAEVMTHWIAGDHYKHGSAGFMGKTWDSFVPGPEYWRECLRVLKPGGHMLVFAGTRTWDLMSVAIRFAGGELRDTIASLGGGPSALLWLHGQGFPKSLNVGKAIDKAAGARREVIGTRRTKDIRRSVAADIKLGKNDRQSKFGTGSPSIMMDHPITAPATPDAKKWDGWHTALKPAFEPILVFRKPLEKGLSIAENVLKWGCGGINVDASRIQAADQHVLDAAVKRMTGNAANAGAFQSSKSIKPNSAQGRFPANLLMSHTLFCVKKGVKRVKPGNGSGRASGKSEEAFFGAASKSRASQSYAPDGFETVEAWECDESCAVRELDRQSGVSKSPTKSIQRKNTWGANGIYGAAKNVPTAEFGDSGGASRFFYVCKPSRRERNAGCEGLEKKAASVGNREAAGRNGSNPKNYHQDSVKRRVETGLPATEPKGNHHPTIKPLKLMRYLITMVTPKNGCVLDPFAGSGTTLAAAKSLGFRFIGIEMDRDYIRIARARVKAA